MQRFVMCRYGAVKIEEEGPPGTFVDTVAVSAEERYRVMRRDNMLYAVRVRWEE